MTTNIYININMLGFSRNLSNLEYKFLPFIYLELISVERMISSVSDDANNAILVTVDK